MADLRDETPYPFLPTLPRDERGGTTQRIQDLIRAAIVRLDLTPGTFLDKSALCARLGVSRFPVSEALGRLAAEGLVEVLPQRGTRVARIDLAECRQAMFIRRALEADAVRVVARRADARLISRLEHNLQRQRAGLEDGSNFQEADLAFHAILLDELGYPRVKAAVAAARARLDRVRAFLPGMQPRAHAGLTEHHAIVEALRERDPARAARAMEDHLDAVMGHLASAAETPDGVRGGRTGATAVA